jgi:hypothetical protein
MNKQERERAEITSAFKEIGAESMVLTGEMVPIGKTDGFRKAIEICERMAKKAPTPEEMHRREVEAAVKTGKKPPCIHCAGVGYVEVENNIARICDCRRAAMKAAARQKRELERPKSDIVSILFEED